MTQDTKGISFVNTKNVIFEEFAYSTPLGVKNASKFELAADPAMGLQPLCLTPVFGSLA